MTVRRTDLLKTAIADTPLELAAYTTDLPAGYDITPHRHAFSTVGYVLEGLFRLTTGDMTKDYRPGEVFTEPAGVVVTGRALEATKLYMVIPRQPGQPEARPA